MTGNSPLELLLNTLLANVPTICSAPSNVKSCPSREITTEIRQYLRIVPTIFNLSPFILPPNIRLINLVIFHVQPQFMNEINTPIELKANPDVQNDDENDGRVNALPLFVTPTLRTVFANVRITPDITVSMIWNHHDIQAVLIINLDMLGMLVVKVLLELFLPGYESSSVATAAGEENILVFTASGNDPWFMSCLERIENGLCVTSSEWAPASSANATNDRIERMSVQSKINVSRVSVDHTTPVQDFKCRQPEADGGPPHSNR